MIKVSYIYVYLVLYNYLPIIYIFLQYLYLYGKNPYSSLTQPTELLPVIGDTLNKRL